MSACLFVCLCQCICDEVPLGALSGYYATLVARSAFLFWTHGPPLRSLLVFCQYAFWCSARALMAPDARAAWYPSKLFSSNAPPDSHASQTYRLHMCFSRNIPNKGHMSPSISFPHDRARPAPLQLHQVDRRLIASIPCRKPRKRRFSRPCYVTPYLTLRPCRPKARPLEPERRGAIGRPPKPG